MITKMFSLYGLIQKKTEFNLWLLIDKHAFVAYHENGVIQARITKSEIYQGIGASSDSTEFTKLLKVLVVLSFFLIIMCWLSTVASRVGGVGVANGFGSRLFLVVVEGVVVVLLFSHDSLSGVKLIIGQLMKNI